MGTTPSCENISDKTQINDMVGLQIILSLLV